MSSVRRTGDRARDVGQADEVGEPSFSTALAAGLDARGLGRWTVALGVAGAGLSAWTLFLVRPGNNGVVACFGVLAALVVVAAGAAFRRWCGHPDRALADLAPGASRIVPSLRRRTSALAAGARRIAAARRRGWSSEQPETIEQRGSTEPLDPARQPEPAQQFEPVGRHAAAAGGLPEAEEVEPGRRVVVAKEPTHRPAAEPTQRPEALPAPKPLDPDDETRPLPSPRRRRPLDESTPTAPVSVESVTPDRQHAEVTPAEEAQPTPPSPSPSPSRRASSSPGGSPRGETGSKKPAKGRKAVRSPRRVAGRGRPDSS
jgi:hypothetical protein